MAAKLGAATAMVGKLGTDSFGTDTVENFKQLGVNVDYLLLYAPPTLTLPRSPQPYISILCVTCLCVSSAYLHHFPCLGGILQATCKGTLAT